MKREIVLNPDVMPPKGPYAQAIKVSGNHTTIYTGTIASLDKQWNVVGANDIRLQTRQTIENLKGILEAAGASLADVISTTWYLTRIEDMPVVAEIRNELFQGNMPASGTIPINGLFYPELLLEMSAIAVIPTRNE
ncbi:RidA family protein [Thorsellia anophelis]|uniref:Enamine deaminase RidA, house cleaning of reactive enamine intermediates, YjgF/YER057c/UK114 family n=1 Tax=Thorsellia anophelis DSM 18579 TaxID=1123402 RepID=A0A1I0A186_9GAMM|nr:RidA family protein [Thorsellia anophelis]SES87434.1 Enamine deaminase RidA, house cleaning of reactive enamine intermediates, YjgF/YER057c/UK114 family [Thorsellia anophelis DSM 18579]